jgi:hypothetical protein
MSLISWRTRARARRCALPFLVLGVLATAGPASLPRLGSAEHSQTHARPYAQTHAARS